MEVGKMIAFYSFTSFTYPTTIFKYDMVSGESELFKEPAIDFDASKYEVKQVFYPSKDGTKIPMFIVHKKGLELNGDNPCFLYGYGGFNISVKPSFSASRLVFLENGGIYAQANMRAGVSMVKSGTKQVRNSKSKMYLTISLPGRILGF